MKYILTCICIISLFVSCQNNDTASVAGETVQLPSKVDGETKAGYKYVFHHRHHPGLKVGADPEFLLIFERPEGGLLKEVFGIFHITSKAVGKSPQGIGDAIKLRIELCTAHNGRLVLKELIRVLYPGVLKINVITTKLEH